MKILLVDDYRPFGQSLKVMLTPEHDVTLVGTATDALAELERTPFDAAFVDLRLPDLSGTEVCARVREAGIPLPHGLILMTGGGTDAALRARLLQLDVKLIEKPFTEEQLYSLLPGGLSRAKELAGPQND